MRRTIRARGGDGDAVHPHRPREPRPRRGRTPAAPPPLEEEIMSTKQALSAVAVAVGIAVCAAPSAAAAKGHPHAPVVEELASFAAPGCTGGCGSGSTIGPDGALYVTDGKAGRVRRVDPRSGAITTFATGLPRSTPPGIGGAIDIAFAGHTAYVLATLAGPGSVPGSTGSDATAPVRRSPTSAGGRSTIHRRPHSPSRAASSTRSSRTRAGSRSPTGTSIASCA